MTLNTLRSPLLILPLLALATACGNPNLPILPIEPEGTVDLALALGVDAPEVAGVTGFDMSQVDFLAGGSAVDHDGSLLLGRGNELHRFIPEGQGRLDGVGIIPSIGRIDGMTVDPQSGRLLVIDGEADLLLDLELPH